MSSKKRTLSDTSEVSDEHIDSLLGNENDAKDSPNKPPSKKACIPLEEARSRSVSPAKSPSKSWLDSPSVVAAFSASKSSSSVPVADYKPLLGSKFKIPKKVIKRCGQCTTCTISDCGFCDNCKSDEKTSDATSQKTCSAKGLCLNPSFEEILKSPVKEDLQSKDNELTSTGEKPKSNVIAKCNQCAGCKQLLPCGECFRCKKGKGGCDKMQCSVKTNENFKKYLEEKLKGVGTGDQNKITITNVLAQLDQKPVDTIDSEETKKKGGRPAAIERCNSCEGCLQKEPCMACGNCIGSGSCSKMICKVRQQQYKEKEKLKKVPASPKLDTVPKPEYHMSIAEKLKLKQLTSIQLSSSQSTPGSSQPSSPIHRGRQPLVPRCGLCPGCLQVDKCDECSNCIKKCGQCFRKRCAVKTKAANQRMKEKKMGLVSGEVKLSDSSDVESISTIDSPISQSPINNGPCNDCEGCIRTEDCGLCSKCTSGKKGCYKRQCFVRKKEAERRSYLKKKLGRPILMKACGDCEGCKANNCNQCENCAQNMAGNISLVCIDKHCVYQPAKATASTPVSTPKASNKKCGSCEGCLADFCRECNYCLSGNEKVMVLCMKRRCQVNKPSGKRRMRCNECEGCKQDDCGECAACIKKGKGEQTNSFCSKRKCINFNESTPSKKAKRTRCGECTGCNSGPCGECLTCQKGYPQLCRAKHCTNPIISEKDTVKKPKMKRIRCGECTGCMSDPCGLCAICQKSPQLCKSKYCTNATLREVVKREKTPRTPSSKTKSVYQKGNNPRRFKKCGECNGCRMEDCGMCSSCKMNAEYGDQMELGKAACLEIVCENPIDLFMTRLDGREGSGYYDKPCFCEGCTKEECGDCENCKGDPKFGGTDDPVKLCILKECQKRTRSKKAPTFKKGPAPKMLKLMSEQEDGTCPTRVINGILYDFRCYFCKKLPRVGSANRSELYRHYAVYHYAAEIKAEFGNLSKCPHCSIDIKGSYVSHMGQKHNEVDKYIPEPARIPISIQGKGGGGNRHRRGAVIVRKRQTNWIWPEIPDGFDPNGEERVVTLEESEIDENKKEALIIDGFEIENNYDEDEEPLFVSRDEPVNIPDHGGKGALCTVCKSTFEDILPAVLHIHDIHNIKGGSCNIMLDTDRLLKCGYIKLTDGATETKITDAGKKSIDPVQQYAEHDVQKKPTARKSTTTSPRNMFALIQKPQAIVEVETRSEGTVIPEGIVVTKLQPKPAVISHILSPTDDSALRKAKIMEAIRINKMGLNHSEPEIKEIPSIDLA